MKINSKSTTISYYNGDITGDYVILVEAIAADGRLGYQELFYEVSDVKP